MSRPKTVNLKTFPLYDKLHTIKQKMLGDVEMTVLYPIKETEQYYVSPQVWASSASYFRMKKDKPLSVEIPVIDNENTIAFLEKHAWHHWTKKDKRGDMDESLTFLNKLFPDKEPVYFFELQYLLNQYCWGKFSSEEPSEQDIEQRKYYTHKYFRMVDTPEIKAALIAYRDEKDEKKKKKKFDEYYHLEENYAYEHFNLTDTFKDIGEHSVCYPVVFTKGTADWSKEKYGKELGYAHAGEIYFVVTKDKVFFETTRHY